MGRPRPPYFFITSNSAIDFFPAGLRRPSQVLEPWFFLTGMGFARDTNYLR
jgi:hypothetical protein